MNGSRLVSSPASQTTLSPTRRPPRRSSSGRSPVLGRAIRPDYRGRRGRWAAREPHSPAGLPGAGPAADQASGVFEPKCLQLGRCHQEENRGGGGVIQNVAVSWGWHMERGGRGGQTLLFGGHGALRPI